MLNKARRRLKLPSPPLFLLLSLFLLSSMAGCAKVQSEPFSKLTASVQQVRSAADQAATQIGAWSTDRTAYQIATMEPNKSEEYLGKIQLKYHPKTNSTDFDPSQISSEIDPLYLKIEKFRIGVYAFNTGIIDYMTAMQALAAPDLVNIATFDTMRSDLNANLNQAASVFNIALPSLSVGSTKIESFALLSTVTTEMYRVILEQRRKSMLIDLIKANQNQIEIASELGKKAVFLLGQAIENEYRQRYGMLELNASGLGPNGRPDASIKRDARLKAANELIALNKAYAAEFLALDALYKTYAELPKAHLELAANLEKPETIMATIADIYSEGQRLYSAYAALNTINTKASQ